MQEISQMKLSGFEEVLAERLQSFNKEEKKNFVIRGRTLNRTQLSCRQNVAKQKKK